MPQANYLKWLYERAQKRRKKKGEPTVIAGNQGGSASLAGVWKRLQRAQKEANEANRRRYEEALDTLRSAYDRATSLGEQFGQRAATQAQQAAKQQMAGQEQDLISRGLGSTTVRQTMQRGVQSDLQNQLAGIEEQKAGILGDIAMRGGESIAGVMERRMDQGPDAAMYAQLMERAQAGQWEQPPRAVVTSPYSSQTNPYSYRNMQLSSGGGGGGGVPGTMGQGVLSGGGGGAMQAQGGGVTMAGSGGGAPPGMGKTIIVGEEEAEQPATGGGKAEAEEPATLSEEEYAKWRPSTGYFHVYNEAAEKFERIGRQREFYTPRGRLKKEFAHLRGTFRRGKPDASPHQTSGYSYKWNPQTGKYQKVYRA